VKHVEEKSNADTARETLLEIIWRCRDGLDGTERPFEQKIALLKQMETSALALATIPDPKLIAE
jgi:hypothetical protein